MMIRTLEAMSGRPIEGEELDALRRIFEGDDGRQSATDRKVRKPNAKARRKAARSSRRGNR